MGHYVYVRNRKRTAYDPKTGKGDRGRWPEAKKIEALTTYLATGSPSMTAAITKIPLETIGWWQHQPWWKEKMAEIKQNENIQLDARLSKVLDKSLDAVLDRIENGEFMYDPRTGEIKRVPAKLRDVQKVAGDMIDKKQLLARVQRGKDSEKQQITADHLVQLAKEFAKFASGKEYDETKDVKSVIDGDHHEVFEQLELEESKGGLQKEEGDESPKA